ncbi:I78 family peptidase inhibitor [Luteimonas panaciterrae]|uniref:I78 family peptidase inhibitor n=1 Tax=Luteimonas panaciterrae TaxID=363885 RepID=UPI001CFB8AF6|nr:I78 family peptidase inhibitor [Luteimonas panaciterrae]
MSFRMLLALSMAMSLSACAHEQSDASDTSASPPASTPPAAAAPANPDDANAPGDCNANAVQSYVGQDASDATLGAIRSATGAKRDRVIKPGDAVTMDYSSARLNIELDEKGKIVRIACG